LTDFLVRLFVKDYKNTENADVRTRYGVFSSIICMIVNVLLFAVKLTIGLLAGAVSVVSDAFNNLSDAASNLISVVGVKIAGRPADDDHPFGHGRIEYITALIVAFLILIVGYEFLKSSIDAIFNPKDLSFSWISVIILAVSLLGKLFICLFNKRLGKKISSAVMEATATDAIGDMAITSVTILSMLIFSIFKINIDGYAGVIVSAMILWAGISVAKDTLQPLIGEQTDPDLRKKLKTFVESYEGVVGTHDLIVHSYGESHYMATIHAEVPDDANIVICHELMDRIERDCKEQLGIMLVIHMDPVSSGIEAEQYRAMIDEILKNIDETLLYHDFRFVNGEKRINLIFDVVAKTHLKPDEEAALIENINAQAKARDSRFCCVITVDYMY